MSNNVGFKPKEPARYPWVWIILILIALMTVPWYARGLSYSKLYFSIPLWVWTVLFWTIILVFSIMAVSHYLWQLEPTKGEKH